MPGERVRVAPEPCVTNLQCHLKTPQSPTSLEVAALNVSGMPRPFTSSLTCWVPNFASGSWWDGLHEMADPGIVTFNLVRVLKHCKKSKATVPW